MSKIRVLIVDDSLTVRKRLSDVLSAQPDFVVVGEAEDGKQGIEMCQALRPDVITMDMMMPVMSGLAATEYIMAYFPTPIVIVSASTNRGELFRTYEALAAGAVDVLDKPPGDDTDAAWESRFTSAVRLVSKIKVITHPRARLRQPADAALRDDPRRDAAPATPGSSGHCRLVAIGASTGGPAAIIRILRELRSTFSLPILLVIHIGETFAASFAEWLNSQSPLPVAYARDGEALPPPGVGRVIMAPPGLHLMVSQSKLRLTSDAERYSCRPSVDVLFESVAREIGSDCVACLLTGMGKDGATGLLAIKKAGGTTWAQDEATSVVFGMPHEAIMLGAADRVLPLEDFAPALIGLANARTSGARPPAAARPRSER